MLLNKSTKLFSEINGYFQTEKKAVETISNLYEKLNLRTKNFGIKDFAQAENYKGDLLLTLLLFPLMDFLNVNQYLSSDYKERIGTGKNTLYRFKNNSKINWRGVVRSINKRLFQTISQKSERTTDSPSCLIIDDTDFEKTGMRIENIGKIWSHVKNCRILGFKGLFLGYSDGTSFFGLDYSLHSEKGKNKKRPFGLSIKQLKARFTKERSDKSHGKKRKKELQENKISNAIKMIKRALRASIKVDYLLMDSWFVCDKMLKLATSKSVHLIGMYKMIRSGFEFEGKIFTVKEIVKILQKRKKVRYNKALGLYVTTTEAVFKGTKLKLFFCKNSKRGKWHLLITTDKKLSVNKAYQIYSIRWSIEVFFKETKQYFGLGKCQSNDFDAQIADVAISMINYNIFSTAKRFVDYETIGGLFRELKDQLKELTIAQRMWGFIVEIIKIAAELTNSNFNELIVSIMKNTEKHNRIVTLINPQLLNAV